MQVSVIIPTYNSATYLAEAIDSVLAQTFRDFEVLVIDDGSTDETEAIMRRYGPPVRCIRQSNAGVAVARNRGIQESLGRYIAFLDSDDTWLPRKLELQMEALARNPEYGACDGAFTIVGPDLSPIRAGGVKRARGTLEELLFVGNVVCICTVVCERSLLERAGGFDSTLSYCADWDMWVRLAALTEFLYVDAPLGTYRQHDSNMSHNMPLLETDSIQVLEKGFAMSGVPESLKSERRRAFAHNYMVLAGTYFRGRRYWDFLRCSALSIAMDFRRVSYLMGFPVRVLGRLRAGHSA